MKKGWYIILVIVALGVAMAGYSWWQSTQPCPADNPLGLGSNCKPQIEGGTAQNPLGI